MLKLTSLQKRQIQALVKEVSEAILKANPATLEEALEVETPNGKISDVIAEATTVIGEKITLRRFEIVEKSDADAFGILTHGRTYWCVNSC